MKKVITPENPQGVLLELTAEEQSQRETDQAKTAEFLARNQYKFDRQRAYPSLAEQLDMQYWDSVNGTTTWADAIAAVKAAHPKPE
jgi:4-alpha-glucanotransferase